MNAFKNQDKNLTSLQDPRAWNFCFGYQLNPDQLISISTEDTYDFLLNSVFLDSPLKSKIIAFSLVASKILKFLIGFCKRCSDWLNFRHFPGYQNWINLQINKNKGTGFESKVSFLKFMVRIQHIRILSTCQNLILVIRDIPRKRIKQKIKVSTEDIGIKFPGEDYLWWHLQIWPALHLLGFQLVSGHPPSQKK